MFAQLDQSRWRSRRTWKSLPPTNTSNIHLQVEQVSLKTNKKLTERLLYNQGCRKDASGIGQEGKRRDQVRTYAPEEKGDYTGGNPPWGVSSSSHMAGALILGSNTRKTCPLGWLEGHWD